MYSWYFRYSKYRQEIYEVLLHQNFSNTFTAQYQDLSSSLSLGKMEVRRRVIMPTAVLLRTVIQWLFQGRALV